VIPFAGDGARRPYKAGSAKAGFAGRARKAVSPRGRPDGDGCSSRRRHEPATGGVRVDRVGVKLPPRAIAAGGADAQWADRPSAGPWPVTSRLAVPRARPPAIRSGVERPWFEKQLRTWATTSAVRGVRTIRRSCSRITGRLQKSTGGVWPSATRGEEPRETTVGLAAPGESIGVAKARRKPGPRWQSRDTGGGLPTNRFRESGPFGSTCRRKALWVVEAAPFDEGAGKAVLGAPGEARPRPGGSRGATESVRDRSSASRAVDNAAARWCRQQHGTVDTSPHLKRWEGEESDRIDRSWGPRRQARSTRGRVAARRADATAATSLGSRWRWSARRKPSRSRTR